MSAQTKSPDITQDSMRPSSLFTNESVFADSAISVGPSTPKFIHADDRLEMASTASADDSPPSLSERLSNLAASAFAIEEEGLLGHQDEIKIQKALKAIQDCIENPDRNQVADESREEEGFKDSVDGEIGLEEIHLHEIHASLAATVASMRQRQQEHRHLHQLTIQKLDAVAQTCLVQRQQLENMDHQLRELREENQKLGLENDTLREHVAGLETQATQKEVAVHAMSSAVAGLEGWINTSPGADPNRTQSAQPTPRRGRIIVRGQGRFRGRYFVDDPEGEVVLDGQDTAGATKDLHEGVRSWLRGFRDVEEELQRASPTRYIMSKETRSDHLLAADEWGEFETVSGT